MKKKVLGAVAAAVMLAPALAASPAHAAGPVVKVWSGIGWSGVSQWLYTAEDNYCTGVGAWNDGIRSARTESSGTVEMWEHSNCTGYSIVVDSSGWSNIGPWVSAIKSHS
ncbi:hypothetical protein DER29_3090 [Micromonospora sp. M71_S20]|uniref:hypothetical protein n=1 Tax=unclassified Micromonospora TaxID=2617518 RepID=UPI000F1353DB|nr:hypothetical protein [Micromonospora sp. M71_S20]RLK25105.1 hypothetical protein DER29_3090 [Micromonospora sp. M71_S20]